MALFKKLFGRKDPLTALRDAHRQKAWAEVVSSAEALSTESFEQNPELGSMVDDARRALVEMNIREARTRFSQGDIQAGQEHLDLAQRYGASDEEVAGLAADTNPREVESPKSGSSTAGVGGGCGSCATTTQGNDVGEVDVDTDDLDLLLAGLPEDLATAYRAKSTSFLEALQLAYAGQDDEACKCFNMLCATEEDEHLCFEYGAALARLGRLDEASELLFKVLALNPGHRLAWELLVDLCYAGYAIDGLAERLTSLDNQPELKAFAASCLARLAWLQGDRQQVVEQGTLALAAGEGSAELVQILAVIHEQREDFDRAEELLGLLSGGGCGGGVHPLLGEYWLRRGKQIDRALEAFKGAARQEPDNPRWPLRIGQAYLARGWRSDGIKVLKQLSSSDNLPDELRTELQQSLEQAG